MTILFLTLKTFSATGGIEKFNRCFSKALHENAGATDWKVQMLSAYDIETDENYLPAALFIGFGKNKWRFFIAALRRMRQADVIIFGHINLTPLILLSAFLYPRRRKICIAHGREVWQALSRQQLKALKSCNQVWSVSRFTATILTGQHGLRDETIKVFPNTLDPFFAKDIGAAEKTSLKKRYGIKENEKIILTVARLADTEKYKGYDIILKLLPSVAAFFPNIKYVLCGKWDEKEKERILLLINASKLHNLVILTGFIKEFELVSHYQMADLFVLPSRKEGFGIVFLEAAWCGLPVIAGNRDGSAEALLHGELGTLVDPDNSAELEEAIVRSLKMPLTVSQQEQQRHLVQEHFGFNQFKKRQATMLNKVMCEW